jgi:hypothetical protein
MYMTVLRNFESHGRITPATLTRIAETLSALGCRGLSLSGSTLTIAAQGPDGFDVSIQLDDSGRAFIQLDGLSDQTTEAAILGYVIAISVTGAAHLRVVSVTGVPEYWALEQPGATAEDPPKIILASGAVSLRSWMLTGNRTTTYRRNAVTARVHGAQLTTGTKKSRRLALPGSSRLMYARLSFLERQNQNDPAQLRPQVSKRLIGPAKT